MEQVVAFALGAFVVILIVSIINSIKYTKAIERLNNELDIVKNEIDDLLEDLDDRSESLDVRIDQEIDRTDKSIDAIYVEFNQFLEQSSTHFEMLEMKITECPAIIKSKKKKKK